MKNIFSTAMLEACPKKTVANISSDKNFLENLEMCYLFPSLNNLWKILFTFTKKLTLQSR